MSQLLRKVLCLDDFEAMAKKRLPRPIFEYVHGGSERNSSLADNRLAYERYGFRPRFLVDVSQRTAETLLFGRTYAAPFGIAPMGVMALSAYRGDIVLAEAAQAANVPMVLSAASLISMEEVVQHAPDIWYQAYLPGDPERVSPLLGRVAALGIRTLVLTIDTQVLANRENNVRAGFSTPLRPSLRLAWDGISHPRWLVGTAARTLLRRGMPHFENSFATRGAPILSRHAERDFSKRDHLTWDHVRIIRDSWKGNLVVKGLIDARDMTTATDLGIDGVIVSNHGGRQLDGTVNPLRVLEDLVGHAGRMTVMMDSGIRRGTDVLKAMALGAAFVFIGRPFNYAVAVAGRQGADRAIAIMKEEIVRDLGLLGVASVSALNKDCLVRI